MNIDQRTLQIVTLAVLFTLVYAQRLMKGSPKQTAEGLAFPLKPLVFWSRMLLLPLYFIFLVAPRYINHQPVPVWLPFVLVALLAFVFYQIPATIVFTPTGLVQHFWLHKDKSIRYDEIMTAQIMGAGRMTRVLGDNRVSIMHTWNHSASDQFRQEFEQRTGKRVLR